MVVRDVVDAAGTPMRRWAVVEKVEAGSPAEKAGVKMGDVLDKVADVKIVCTLDLERAFLDRPVGEKLNIVTRRGASDKGEGGREVNGDVLLKVADKSPAIKPDDIVWKKLGLKVQPAPLDQVLKVNPQLHGGLMITEVSETAVAGKAGFQRGDILIGLHQYETITIDNITFVINHPDLTTWSPLKYFRIRGGQLQRGWLGNLE
jgi:serine protease Do